MQNKPDKSNNSGLDDLDDLSPRTFSLLFSYIIADLYLSLLALPMLLKLDWQLQLEVALKS